jgi:hypothetical protein
LAVSFPAVFGAGLVGGFGGGSVLVVVGSGGSGPAEVVAELGLEIWLDVGLDVRGPGRAVATDDVGAVGAVGADGCGPG